MGQCEQLESQADASWMYEFSPMVFPSRMKSHLDPCRSISSNKKDMGSKRRKWGMGKRCEYSMEEGYFLYEGGGNLEMCWLLLNLYWRMMINKILKSIF